MPSRDEFDDEEITQIRRYEDFSTIDWIEDSMLERNRRIRKERQQSVILEHGSGAPTWRKLLTQAERIAIDAFSWFVIGLAGACIGLNAALISIITEWLSDLKLGYCADGWWLNRDFCCWELDDSESGCPNWHVWSPTAIGRWFLYVLFAVLFSYVAAHLVHVFARYAAGSGISEIKVIIAGFVMKSYLGGWTLIIKSITLPFVIASGLSVGKEGPSVHVACCIGNVIARMFSRFSRSQAKMREILTAASAAGVAVAFGSPVGGVLFSIEEMSHSFSIKTMWRSFFCALVATVTLQAMNPFRSGKLVLFQVTYDRDWHFFEIVFFIIIGVFGGLYGAFVIKFNLQVMAFRRKYLASSAKSEVVILAMLTAIFGYFNQFLRIDMTESMSVLFRECEDGGDYHNLCQTWAQWRMANSLFLATMFRIGFVILSYGCKVPCGIFVPSMAIGATFGRMVGIIVKAMYRANPQSGWFAACKPDAPCITPGTYAFLGAAAALGGVMRITVSVVVIMFELTGALTYILPTMIVLLVTKSVGDLFGRRGIADEFIRFNGYPYLDREDHAFNIPVSHVMKRELETLPATGFSVADVEARLEKTPVSGYPIVSADGNRVLHGYIGRSEVTHVLKKYRREGELPQGTTCSFLKDGVPMNQDGGITSLTSGPALGIEDDDGVELMMSPAGTEHVIRFWPWANQTPLTVSPLLSLEIVMQMFRRLGPKVVLVEERGSLVGLVTIKDVLLFMEREHHETSWDDPAELSGILEEALASTSRALRSIFDRITTFGRS